MPKLSIMRRVVGAICGVGLAVFASGAARAASVTINDVSDDFTIPFSYDTGGTHRDTVAVHVTGGGDFFVRLTLLPISGDFRRLDIGLAYYVSPESALPSGHTLEGTMHSYVGTYYVRLASRRQGSSGTIAYNLLINTVFEVQPLTLASDNCDPVDPPEVPIPAGAILFLSGLAFLGVSRRLKHGRA